MNQRLLVEGQNDLHVILNLWKVLGLKDVKNYNKRRFPVFAEGKQNIPLKIAELLSSSDLENIGIVVDADKSTQSTWQSLRFELEKYEFTLLPDVFPIEGLILKQAGLPKVGLWIMPDNAHHSTEDVAYLEHFYERIIKPEDKLLQKATEIVTEISQDNDCRFTKNKFQKAKIHTWLSWQEEPGIAMGFNLRRDDLFDFKNPIVLNFKIWLENTFELENGSPQ